MDFEGGYQLEPAQIAQRLIAIGAAGMNLEDSDDHSDAPTVDAEQHAERLAAVKSAARAAGVDLVLNARGSISRQALTASIRSRWPRQRRCQRSLRYVASST